MIFLGESVLRSIQLYSQSGSHVLIQVKIDFICTFKNIFFVLHFLN